MARAPVSGQERSSDRLRQSPSRVAEACKVLVREIRRRRLDPGAQLPPQEMLRQHLGFSHRTLSEAMGVLCDAGLVTRKRRSGTRVVAPDRLPRGLFTIGLAVPRLDDAYVGGGYATLTGLIEARLTQLGCGIRVYPHLRSMFLREKHEPIDSFDGLRDDVGAGMLDALITTYSIDGGVCAHWLERGLLIAQAATTSADAPVAVTLDTTGMMQDALAALRERGVRRPALALGGGPPLDERPPALDLIREFTGRLNETGHRPVYVAHSLAITAGEEVAAQLLREPASRRPDGLIVTDDYLAMGLTASLAETDYRPLIVARTVRQKPLAYALPVLRFETDVAAQADAVVEMTVAAMLNPSTLPRRRVIRPEATDGVARRVPAPQDGTPTTAFIRPASDPSRHENPQHHHASHEAPRS